MFCINKRGGFRRSSVVRVQLHRTAIDEGGRGAETGEIADENPIRTPLMNKKFVSAYQGIWLTGQVALRLISRNTLRDCYSALPSLPLSTSISPLPLRASVNSPVPGLNYPLIAPTIKLAGIISFVFRLSLLSVVSKQVTQFTVSISILYKRQWRAPPADCPHETRFLFTFIYLFIYLLISRLR